MQDGKRKLRRISVHAKAKGFDFKMRATQIFGATWASSSFPSSSRLSFLLRFRAFFLQLRLKSQPEVPSFTSKSKRLLGKLQRRLRVRKNQAPAALKIADVEHPEETRSPTTTTTTSRLGQLIPEEPMTVVGSMIVGVVAFLSQLISQIIAIPTTAYSLAILSLLLLIILLLTKFVTSYFCRLLLTTIAALMLCWVGFDLRGVDACGGGGGRGGSD